MVDRNILQRAHNQANMPGCLYLFSKSNKCDLLGLFEGSARVIAVLLSLTKVSQRTLGLQTREGAGELHRPGGADS